jgi:integrase
LKVYKRGKVYWFKLQFEGTLYQKSTKQTSKVKAEGAAAAFRTALANRNFGIIERKPVPVFEDAMKAFLAWSAGEHKEHPATYRRYKTSSKSLLAYLKFKGKPIDQITPATIEDYKTSRARQKGKRTKRLIKPATINRELACLKAMYFHVLKDRHDFRNPVSEIELLPENNEQERVLTFDEQRIYLQAANDTLKDVAGLILETGMRPEEVYRAKVENVNLELGYLYNPHGKTKAARREVPLNSLAAGILKRRLGRATGIYLFPHKMDKDKPMLKANNSHTKALKDSKVRAFRIYDLRHTWATRAAESGMDIGTLASLLGHAKLNMVTRYVHPGKAHRIDAVNKLELVNAAKEIAEVEKKTAEQKKLATISDTAASNPANFLGEEIEGKPNRIS